MIDKMAAFVELFCGVRHKVLTRGMGLNSLGMLLSTADSAEAGAIWRDTTTPIDAGV